MKKHSKNILFMAATVASALALAPTTQAEDHKAGVWAMDQSVGNGVVSARKVVAEENGWLVVHRTDSAMKPGPVVAHAPLRAGKIWMWRRFLPRKYPPVTCSCLWSTAKPVATRPAFLNTR